MAEKEKKHYIDNVKFYTELVKYINICNEKRSQEKDIPKVPNYIAECFMKIAENLGNMKSFRNYMFLSEMQSDAVYYCLKYMHNYDPDKYNNPFAYFTKISYFAFIRKIQEEKKILYKKYKSIMNTEMFLSVSDTQQHDTNFYSTSIVQNDHTRENIPVLIYGNKICNRRLNHPNIKATKNFHFYCPLY